MMKTMILTRCNTIESAKPLSGRLPRYDRSLHGRLNPIRFRKYLSRPRGEYAANKLSCLTLHRCAGWRTALLATFEQQIWSQTHLSHLIDLCACW